MLGRPFALKTANKYALPSKTHINFHKKHYRVTEPYSLDLGLRSFTYLFILKIT